MMMHEGWDPPDLNHKALAHTPKPEAHPMLASLTISRENRSFQRALKHSQEVFLLTRKREITA